MDQPAEPRRRPLLIATIAGGLALLAAVARHERHRHARRGREGHHAATGDRLVVRVGVDEQQRTGAHEHVTVGARRGGRGHRV